MKIILLAGGDGTRLWPMTMPPKPFSHFLGQETLYQKTLRRFISICPPEDFVIVTKASFRSFAMEQAAEIHPILETKVITEQESKNTLPALLYALRFLENTEEMDPYFLVSPCDHLIAPENLFLEKIHLGMEAVNISTHILFGVFPTHPHTGYGYIQCNTDHEISKGKSFIEKPTLEVAQNLIHSKTFLWNTGIFLFHRELFFQDLSTYQPEMFEAYQSSDFSSIAPISIDQGLLEFSSNLHVVSLPISWSDVGCWENVNALFENNEENNILLGDIEVSDSENCFIYATSRPIRTVGIKDLIIVDSPDGVLIKKKTAPVFVQKNS